MYSEFRFVLFCGRPLGYVDKLKFRLNKICGFGYFEKFTGTLDIVVVSNFRVTRGQDHEILWYDQNQRKRNKKVTRRKF